MLYSNFFTGSTGNDMVNQDGFGWIIDLFGGDDTFFGALDYSFINGGTGDDSLIAMGEQVTMYGGAGNDRLTLFTEDYYGWSSVMGGAGDDTIRVAGSGRAVATGGAGNDTMYGGSGHNSFEGNNGRDILRGGGGNDYLNGGAGNDFISGGTGDDSLFGENGRDRLVGGRGNDFLVGGAGNDRLNGGAGDDWLEGNAGRDVMRGGGGEDTFVFFDGDAGTGVDHVRDFDAEMDEVLLIVAEGSRVDLDQVGDNARLLVNGQQLVVFHHATADEVDQALNEVWYTNIVSDDPLGGKG